MTLYIVIIARKETHVLALDDFKDMGCMRKCFYVKVKWIWSGSSSYYVSKYESMNEYKSPKWGVE